MTNSTRETWIVVSLRALSSFGWSAMIPFLAIYLAVERGLPFWFVGSIYSVSGVLSLSSGIVGGRLTDLLGPKRVMVVAYLSSSISSFLLWYLVLTSGSSWSFFAVYPTFSFARGLSQPASSAIVANLGYLSATRGFSLLLIGGNLGFTAGPALGGFLIQGSGYQSVFLLCAVTSLAVAAMTAAGIRGGKLPIPRDEPGISSEGRKFKRWPSWKEGRTLIMFLILVFSLSVVVGYQNTPFSLYASDFLHLQNSLIGLLYATNGLVIVIFQLPLMRLVRRLNSNIVFPLVISSFVTMAGLIMATFASTSLHMAIVMVLITFGEILLSAPSQNVINQFSIWKNRGTYQGLHSAFFEGGVAAAVVLGPFSLELLRDTPALAWASAALLAFATGLALLALAPRLQRDYDKLRRNQKEKRMPQGEY